MPSATPMPTTSMEHPSAFARLRKLTSSQKAARTRPVVTNKPSDAYATQQPELDVNQEAASLDTLEDDEMASLLLDISEELQESAQEVRASGGGAAAAAAPSSSHQGMDSIHILWL